MPGFHGFAVAFEMTVLALVLALVAAAPALAQEGDAPAPTDTLVGSVVRDGTPLPGIPVTLHRVTSQTSGEVATAVTGDDGSFRFPLEGVSGASFNVFFVTAEYLSVRYFGDPVHLDQPRDRYSVAVYDTTSTPVAPARVSRRDVVLLPQPNDSWEVNEIVSILNPGERAIVGDSGMPTLEVQLPDGAADFQAGEGDILPHEVSFMDDRVLLVTPVIPGRRDLFIRYRIPGDPSDAAFLLSQPTDTFNLYVQQPSHLTGIEGLSSTQMIEVEGEQFLQYGATDLPVGAEIALDWAGGSPIDPVTAAVAVTVALLASGAWVAFRNRRPAAAV